MPDSDSERSFEQQLIDELVPDEMDWEDLVRSYPASSLLVAALGGYFIGRRSGRAIVAAFSESAVDRVTGLVNELLDRDLET